jgi:hypothetical protein
MATLNNQRVNALTTCTKIKIEDWMDMPWYAYGSKPRYPGEPPAAKGMFPPKYRK